MTGACIATRRSPAPPAGRGPTICRDAEHCALFSVRVVAEATLGMPPFGLRVRPSDAAACAVRAQGTTALRPCCPCCALPDRILGTWNAVETRSILGTGHGSAFQNLAHRSKAPAAERTRDGRRPESLRSRCARYGEHDRTTTAPMTLPRSSLRLASGSWHQYLFDSHRLRRQRREFR